MAVSGDFDATGCVVMVGIWQCWRGRRTGSGESVVTMSWRLTALRQQLGHAEKRKNRSKFDVHERYNDIVDGLAHEINDRMPVYASFSRDHAPHTTLWHDD